MRYTREDIDLIPDLIGIYIFRSSEDEILYIGKSIHLKQRVRNYFFKSSDDRAMIPQLINQVSSIEILTLPTESDALAAESNYIKKYQPKYNALLKDDKTYLSLKLCMSETWPFLEVVRLKEHPIGSKDLYFGPYPNLSHAKRLIKFLNAYFKLRQCSNNEFKSRKRPCLLYELNQCSAPCTKIINEHNYLAKVEQLSQVLKGKQGNLIKHLAARRDELSDRMEYERAQILHDHISDLKKIPQYQIVHTITQSTFYIIALYENNFSYALCVLHYEKGKLIHQEYDYFNQCATSPEQIIQQVIFRLYTNNKKINTFLINIPQAINCCAQILPSIKISCPKKGIKLELIHTALDNAKLYFSHISQAAIQDQTLENLTTLCNLEKIPEAIDCFDVSNFSGDHMVATCVRFDNGSKNKSLYRKFTLKNIPPGDDCKGILQAVNRRYKNITPEEMPDLILVDGSIQQVKAAQKAIAALSIIGLCVIGLSKENAKHDKGIRNELLILSNLKKIHLSPTSKELFFLQNIRDEAHRYAISFLKSKQTKDYVKHPLDSIKGIGPKKKVALMKIFGSWDNLISQFRNKKNLCSFLNKNDINNIEEKIDTKNLKS